ncbi:MAG: FHA domain-containing protein [Lachnospiraceae bacterium]|nr:FHA domain-containing protein [Lachnospiraceae bacterium]MDD3616575.1 FHA domain-containing protein [Lachnospiraceae bacterium]
MTTESKTLLFHPKEEGDSMLLGFHRLGHVSDIMLKERQSLGRETGMDDEAEIAVPSPIISRKHGEFGVVGGRCFYRDLGSSNGTWINGQLCRDTYTLQDGDIISFRPRRGDYIATEFEFIFTRDMGEGFEWEKYILTDEVQEIMIGRGTGKIDLEDEFISKCHATFFQGSKGWSVIDLGSTNGIYVNHEKIAGCVLLNPMDVIRIGNTWFVYQTGRLWVGKPRYEMQKRGVLEENCGERNQSSEVENQNLEERYRNPEVQNQNLGEGCCNQKVQLQNQQRDRDEYGDDEDLNISGAANLVIDIQEKNVWSRFKKKTLLKDINLTVNPGDFLLILGGSGAGKSTFMNAVMGYEKAEGTVQYGDLDIYEEYEQIKYNIGFVPQQDTLRMNDTVFHILYGAAQMKMSSESTKEEWQERTGWVMSLLGLSREQDTLVGRLSGGQRKRLSIALELIGNPALFFLDEPDSGLDGIMARELMENLKTIADMGKMVMMITHGPDRAADLFTKVLVLAKSEEDNSGHLVYYGGIKEAKDYFQSDSLEGIVRKINRKDEGGEGLADYYIKKYRGLTNG